MVQELRNSPAPARDQSESDSAKKNVMNCSFPGQVIHVAAKIAELKKLPVQAVLIANVNNASTIYHRYFI